MKDKEKRKKNRFGKSGSKREFNNNVLNPIKEFIDNVKSTPLKPPTELPLAYIIYLVVLLIVIIALIYFKFN